MGCRGRRPGGGITGLAWSADVLASGLHFKIEIIFFLIGAELREEQGVEGKTGADGIVRTDSWKWGNGMKKKFSWIQFSISKTEKGAFKEKDL